MDMLAEAKEGEEESHYADVAQRLQLCLKNRNVYCKQEDTEKKHSKDIRRLAF